MASDLVEGATSDVLYDPDWGLNIELCDIVNDDPRQAKEVLKAVKKRLGNKNPKVQILALVLIETLLKNSGDNICLQLVERGILNEMVKIVKKKPDKKTEEKILALLNEWKESFGGPQGKFPQYYEAYHELARAGVKFPQNVDSTSVVLENQDAQACPLNSHSSSSPGNGTEFGEASTDSNHPGLNSMDIEKARSTMEVLMEMLNALDPCNKEGVKDEIIMDLIEQCSFNQQQTMQLVVTTSDEQLLFQGLALNDELQHVLAKHDAIASGSYFPSESIPTPSLPLVNIDREEEVEEDHEGQLFRRSSRVRMLSEGEVSISTRNHPTNTQPSPPSTLEVNTPLNKAVQNPTNTRPTPPSTLEVNTPLNKAVQNPDLLSTDAYNLPPLKTLSQVNPGKYMQPSSLFQKVTSNKDLMSQGITTREEHSPQLHDETETHSNGRTTSSVIPTTQSNGNQKKMRNHGKAMHSVQGDERKMNTPEVQKIDPIGNNLQVRNNKITSNLRSAQVENDHKGPQIHDKIAMPAIPPPPSKYTERQKFFQQQKALASGQFDQA